MVGGAVTRHEGAPDASGPVALVPPSRPAGRGGASGGGWSFVPLAPLVVVVVGLAVALGIGLVGLDHLARAADEHSGARADLLAVTVAARLSQLPPERRLEATQLAARRSDAGILVVTPDARIIHDVSAGALDKAALEKMLVDMRGVAQMRFGRSRFSVRAIGAGNDAPRIVVFVAEPPAGQNAPALLTALLALAVMLLGVARRRLRHAARARHGADPNGADR